MALPRLIHPIPVVIKLRDRADALMDEDSGEPIGNVGGDNVSLVAQVSWRSTEIKVDGAGNTEVMDGYLLFRLTDLVNHIPAVVISEGDRVVSIGSGIALVPMNHYLWRIQRRGHYPDQGGHTLQKWWFKDKNPVVPRT